MTVIGIGDAAEGAGTTVWLNAAEVNLEISRKTFSSKHLYNFITSVSQQKISDAGAF